MCSTRPRGHAIDPADPRGGYPALSLDQASTLDMQLTVSATLREWMIANGGEYGGIRFFDTSTVKKFASQFSDRSRRGLGFDKPETYAGKASPCCKTFYSAPPLVVK